MLQFETSILSGGNMASATLTSHAQQVKQMGMASIQAVWTGSPVGSLKLQISNDDVTYSDYTGSSTSVSGAGNFMWNVIALPAPYIRAVYTRVSGTGTLNISIDGKGV